MKGSGLRLKGITRGLIRAVKEMDKEVVDAESTAAVVSNKCLHQVGRVTHQCLRSMLTML